MPIFYWTKISKMPGDKMYVVYAGLMDQARTEGQVLGWKTFGKTIPRKI